MKHLAIVFFILSFGCGVHQLNSSECENVRSGMCGAAPVGAGTMQTYFAHIGDLQIDSEIYHVAVQRLVLMGMDAPRGLRHRLLLFDTVFDLVASYEFDYNSSEPLWCEGNRVYLFGTNGSFYRVEASTRLDSLMGAECATGNVLDFSGGPCSPILTREMKYGSSGGLSDDPWLVVSR